MVVTVPGLLGGCVFCNCHNNEQDRLEAEVQELSLYFDADKYQEVIDKFDEEPDLYMAPGKIRNEALRYKAYSECLLDEKEACSNTFMQILEFDPDYELPIMERKHPMWGPVFDKQKQKIIDKYLPSEHSKRNPVNPHAKSMPDSVVTHAMNLALVFPCLIHSQQSVL